MEKSLFEPIPRTHVAAYFLFDSQVKMLPGGGRSVTRSSGEWRRGEVETVPTKAVHGTLLQFCNFDIDVHQHLQ